MLFYSCGIRVHELRCIQEWDRKVNNAAAYLSEAAASGASSSSFVKRALIGGRT